MGLVGSHAQRARSTVMLLWTAGRVLLLAEGPPPLMPLPCLVPAPPNTLQALASLLEAGSVTSLEGRRLLANLLIRQPRAAALLALPGDLLRERADNLQQLGLSIQELVSAGGISRHGAWGAALPLGRHLMPDHCPSIAAAPKVCPLSIRRALLPGGGSAQGCPAADSGP